MILAMLLFPAVGSAQSVSRQTFSSLQEVQELMDAEQYGQARVLLEELIVKVGDIPYDFALINQYLAHTSVMLDDVPRARRALEAALEVEELPDDLRTNMNLFYGTVLLGDEEYELARDALEVWYSLAELPTATQVFSYAYATYMSGDVPGSQPLVERAIAESLEPPDNWYQLYYRVLFEQKRYADAEVVLKGMIARAPTNAVFLRMLASHYLQLEQSNDGLAALMIAYSNELLDAEADLRQIVSLWGFIDAPEKGARLLEEWLHTERLATDAESLKQLGNLWLMARERNNALSVLTRAAEMSPDGRTYELLGGIYFEEEQWTDALDAYEKALRTGDLEVPLRASLLAGISAFRAGDHDKAREALEAARASEEFRPQADSLLRQLR